ncbi:MAG: sigma-70 family RNA polymerase sigma factor [Ruminococcaceae bacterium]|nr:sigma-70 family RNA polymerase sigma factor [Oscillospiraceae bacterium]
MFLCLSLLDNEEDRIYFEMLYEKYGDDIFKRIYNMVKNHSDAEDIMQETWLSIAENLEFYRAKNERMIRAYIFRVAKNRSITFYREKRKEEERRSDIALVDLKDTYDYETILFNVCAKIDVKIIIECINSLEEKYSDILNYFYLHNHTVKEISKILNLKEETVKTRLYRGRIKLLQMLEGRNLNDR